jgi:hypothetical protein
VGLLTKYTVLALGAAVVTGLLLTPWRRELAKPWIYLGGLVTLALFLPNLLWQIRHGFPTFEFIVNNNADARFSPIGFLFLQAIFIGPFSLPIFVSGFLFLFSRQAHPCRLLGWTAVLVFTGFLAAQSKPYYAAPIYPLLFAAGAVLLERRLNGRVGLRRWWPACLLLGNLILLPIFMPVLPVKTYARVHDRFPHPEFGEMFGWQQLVQIVGEAYEQLPVPIRAETALLTSNYGSAAALDLFGSEYGLPAAACGQNSYYYWSRPDSLDSTVAVGFQRERLEALYREVLELGVISNVEGVRNEEADRPFFLVRGAKLDADKLWEELRSFR